MTFQEYSVGGGVQADRVGEQKWPYAQVLRIQLNPVLQQRYSSTNPDPKPTNAD